MSITDIIRAWKDEEYRHSLSPEQREQIPANPVEFVELNDEEISSISGGCTTCGDPWHTIEWTCKPIGPVFELEE